VVKRDGFRTRVLRRDGSRNNEGGGNECSLSLCKDDQTLQSGQNHAAGDDDDDAASVKGSTKVKKEEEACPRRMRDGW
jgi:hypothetical protein